MKRSICLLLGLVTLPLVGLTPVAEATGVGVCTITGTMTFTASSVSATQGGWAVGPAGTYDSPSLKRAFQLLAPYEGDCARLTAPRPDRM